MGQILNCLVPLQLNKGCASHQFAQTWKVLQGQRRISPTSSLLEKNLHIKENDTLLFFYPLTALANKITWWIFHGNMGSGISTTEDEGHLDDIHEETRNLFFFSSQHVMCCFPFFKSSTASGIRTFLQLAWWITESLFQDRVYTTFSHCELMRSDLFSHR